MPLTKRHSELTLARPVNRELPTKVNVDDEFQGVFISKENTVYVSNMQAESVLDFEKLLVHELGHALDNKKLGAEKVNSLDYTTSEKRAEQLEKAWAKRAKLPNESPYDYVLRTHGINPRIEEANDPHMLLRSWQDMWRRSGELLGMDPAESARLEPWALRFAATIGKGLGETRVLPVSR